MTVHPQGIYRRRQQTYASWLTSQIWVVNLIHHNNNNNDNIQIRTKKKWGAKTHPQKVCLVELLFLMVRAESCHDRFYSHFSFCLSEGETTAPTQQQQRWRVIGLSLKCQQTLNWYAILYISIRIYMYTVLSIADLHVYPLFCNFQV